MVKKSEGSCNINLCSGRLGPIWIRVQENWGPSHEVEAFRKRIGINVIYKAIVFQFQISTNLKMTNFRRFGAWLVLKFQTCDCEIEGSPTEGVHCGVSVGFPILALLSAAACLRDRRIPAALNQASAGSSDDPCCSCAERGLMKIIEENG